MFSTAGAHPLIRSTEKAWLAASWVWFQCVLKWSTIGTLDWRWLKYTEVFRDWELVHPWSLQWQDAQVAYFLEPVLCDTRPQVTTWFASIAFEALSLSCVIRNIFDDVNKKFGICMHLYAFVHLILCGRLARRHAVYRILQYWYP